MLAIADLKISNLQSVLNAFDRVGIKGQVTSNPEVLGQAKAIILPGVGHFAKGIDSLRMTGLDKVILDRVANEKIPLLGICLGMQLLAEASEEGGHSEGLGLIKGRVVKLRPTQPGYLTPNISWYPVTPSRPGVLFPKAESRESFYFVHSYHMITDNPSDVAATISYSGQDICAAVERENVFGVQFHPEKSQDAGLDLLYDFKLYLERTGVA